MPEEITIETWIVAIPVALALLGFLAGLTPTEADDRIVGRLRNLWRKLRGGSGPGAAIVAGLLLVGCADTEFWAGVALRQAEAELQLLSDDTVTWTPEQTDRARRLCIDGLSIARHYGYEFSTPIDCQVLVDNVGD